MNLNAFEAEIQKMLKIVLESLRIRMKSTEAREHSGVLLNFRCDELIDRSYLRGLSRDRVNKIMDDADLGSVFDKIVRLPVKLYLNTVEVRDALHGPLGNRLRIYMTMCINLLLHRR